MAARKKLIFDFSDASTGLSKNIPPPPGFANIVDGVEDEGSVIISADLQLAAKQRQVMAIAYGPGKSLMSTAFMLWMSGSSIQIFSIMTTGMALFTPIKGLTTINLAFGAFEKEEGVDLRLAKLLYISLQILALGVALYKTYTMGLLPVTSADWTFSLLEKQFVESFAVPN
jgi:hypothetical protein